MLSCLLQLACCIEKLHRVERQEVYAGLSFTVGVFCGNLAFCGRTTSVCLGQSSCQLQVACWSVGLPKPCLEYE